MFTLSRLFLCVLFIWSASLHAQDTEASDEAPPVEKIGETTYQLGEISFDAATREIRIPSRVNIRDGGPLEYVLVHETGKVHESLFKTEARPFNLQIVLKLLRYEAGMGDVLAPMLPADEREVALTKKAERGEAVEILVDWTPKSTGERTLDPVEGWIADGVNRAPIDPDAEAAHWVYTGSYFSDSGGFLSEVEGSMIGIYLDRVSLFNTPLEGSDNDERWGANGEVTPDLETPVTLVIRPKKMSHSGATPTKDN